LSTPEEEPGGGNEVAGHKATFFDALKGLEAARKHMCQVDTENNITVMCKKVENALHRLRGGKKKETKDSY
jgi:RecA/RadA recombinase